MNLKFNFKSLAFHLLVPIMLLFIILMIIPEYNEYFRSLSKPFPIMPDYAFFAIYSLMYFIFGIGAYLVDESEGVNKKAFNYYFSALLLNLLYIPIMFGTRYLLVGFLWSFLLLVFIYLTYREFKKVNKTSGILFVIYFIFGLFLVYYSFFIYILNK